MAKRRVLGLDIGSNSIGWALLDLDEDQSQVVATGARIFPEGVDRDQQGAEHSKNEARRIARGMRRQIARRSRRKQRVRQALIRAGLYPVDPQEQARLDQLDPYSLRSRALDSRLEPFEIGRILIHLNQRRGFLSNKKGDRDKQKEDSKTLAEISQLEQDIKAAGHRTLGEHLASAYAANPLERLRGKHTRRSMFVAEFDQIWAQQQSYHPELLTDQLKYGRRGQQTYPRRPERIGKDPRQAVQEVGLFGLTFFQRKLKPPKSVVGQCEYDPKQKRCPRADRAAQRFRVLQEVNNLRVMRGDGEICELTDDQRGKVLAALAEKDAVEFDKLRKLLGLLESDAFNLERGDRHKLDGMKTDAILANKKYYGKEWHKLPEATKTAIVRSLIHDDEETFVRRAGEEFGLDAELAARLFDAPLPEGYASLGRETIERLLPHLERRLPLMTRDGAPCALRLAGFLAPWERPVKAGQYLPEPPDITNPLVRQAIHEVRKLVNAVVREFGRPDAIHIELAREVKGNSIERARYTRDTRERARERDRVAEILTEFGEKPTRSKIDLYRLWEEQDRCCVYSGRVISEKQLLGGEVNVDHILPYSRTLDDSLANKVVCFRSENDAKGNQTPHEWLVAKHPDRYEELLQRVARLAFNKRARFSQKSCQQDEFIARQLNDTAYITSAVHGYLQKLGVDVVASKGQLTAELRHQWGLNKVLNLSGEDRKNRDDHRHHAVDAIVIALLDRSRLQQLARSRGQTELPAPWKGFREQVESAVNQINVSHRVRRKLAGALHEETLYGPTEQAGVFVYRKPLEALTTAMIEDIRDEGIRRIVVARLKQFGIEPGDKKSISKEVWREPLLMPSGVQIKKVRLKKADLTIQPLRDAAMVKPGNTHHIAIYEFTDAKGKARREMIATTMLEAIRRHQAGESIIRRVHPKRSDARFLMSLSYNEAILADIRGTQGLFVYRTAGAIQGQIYFISHTDARPSSDATKYAVKASTLNGKKVTVDLLGRIRWAND
ncbi:MAG: type II CRISPR RNA-guided endonuclease Cas9 [Planctomycetes bacterium]|nr:type II CRISPR RNA-guided endonuclease Cas9 [Planctomycetota bacterium]